MVQVQTRILESLQRPIARCLLWLDQSLLRVIPHPREERVAQLVRCKLESLPTDLDQHCFLVNWTDSAIRLIRDGERRAARYQLQQVLRKVERLLD